MAKSFALVNVLTISLFLTTFFSLSSSSTTTISKHHHLAVKLIHRDSLHSPFYKPSATLSDRANRAYRSSIARFAYIQVKIRGTSTFITKEIQVGVVADDGIQFLANISIGTPPIPTLLHMDTASDLLWLQCLPCTNCYNQSVPVFDPSKSSTFANLLCNSSYCNVLPRKKACDSFRNCKYEYEYLDHSKSKGNLATDVLTLGTCDANLTTLPNVVFGCGHENTGLSSIQESGVLGLSYPKISLVSQLNSNRKFSYCLGNISDPSYAYNKLIFGISAKIEGYNTPMEMYKGFYYLTLEDVSVGTERLQIKPGTFTRTKSGSGGVIIDSGSTFCHLAPDGYDALSDAVTKLLNKSLERVTVPDHEGQICYKGNEKDGLTGFPMVTFHFAQGADLVLDHGSMFVKENEETFCMAILVSDFDNVSVIGTMAQQFYNIGFDLDGKTVSFKKIDCELID